MKQTKLEKKTYRRELTFGVVVLAGLAIGSSLLTRSPTISEISASVFEDIDPSRHDTLLTQANNLLTGNPDLIANPGRWEKELKRLATGLK